MFASPSFEVSYSGQLSVHPGAVYIKSRHILISAHSGLAPIDMSTESHRILQKR